MGDAGTGGKRLLDWLKRTGRLRVYPEGDVPMVARIGERRVLYTDVAEAEVILRLGWTEAEVAALQAEMEADP